MLIFRNVISITIFFLEFLPIVAAQLPAAGSEIVHDCNGKKFKHSTVQKTARIALKAIQEYVAGTRKIGLKSDLRVEKSFFDPKTKTFRTSFNWPLRSSARKFAPGKK
ncbi:CSEP0369 putative effector protein [Blumeria hordei DH14]|uniref:CSEP0369 putative effector protein n=1 Tax=Blumeria graminis f. sp. hordei (strain DH14) TaxID=546991 RepID=N1JFH6_BLUG1|nr:CSEP0369 putative effector protein [Blumeria hordei DH14]